MSSTTIETNSTYLAEAKDSPVSEFSVEVAETIVEHAREVVIVEATDETSIEADVSGLHGTVAEDDAVRTPSSDVSQSTPEASAASLAEELTRLIESVAAVEDLSNAARKTAATDLARYEAALVSAQQYRDRLGPGAHDSR